ncbi:hypothetical protein, partial [Enterobacter hormaechei]|uniref:hypothetical protein n=1 Tax=Enterobacter hormaechei TaxID=158836 RepID=UPI001E3074E9
VCVVGKMRELILQLSNSSIYSTKPQECHTERAFTVSDLCMTAFANPHTMRTLCKAERALYCFVFHSYPNLED